MGDSIYIDPRTGLPASLEQTPEAVRATGVGLTNLPVGMLGSVIPAGQDEQGNVTASAPAIATGTYGGIGTIVPRVLNAVLPKLGFDPTRSHQENLPGAEEALRQAAASERLAATIVPHMEADPNVPAEQVIQSAGRTGGAMILPIPGAAIERVAGAAAPVVKAIIPNLEGAKAMVPAGAVLGGGVEAFAQSKEAEAKALDARAAALNADPNSQTSQVASLPTQPPADSSGQPSTSGPGPGPSGPSVSTSSTSQAPYTLPQGFNLDQFIKEQQELHGGVDFSQSTGKSDWTIGEELATGAAALAGMWLVLKHGGKVWTDASDVVRNLKEGGGIAAPTAARQANVARANQVLDTLRTDPTAATAATTAGAPLRGDVPLPGTMESLGTRAHTYWVDENTHLRELVKQNAVNPEQAEDLAAMLGTTNNTQSMSRRNTSMFNNGIDPSTGKPVVKLTEWAQDIQQLPQGLRDLADTAMYAKRELFDRTRLMNMNIADPNATGPIPELRFNYRDTPSDTLRNAVNLAESIPEVRSIMERAWAMGRRDLENGLERGYLTQQDFDRVTSQNPYYVPSTDDSGRITGVFDQRELTPNGGWQSPPTNSWNAIIQHRDELYRAMAKNDNVRAVINQGLKRQRLDPNAPQIFEEKFAGRNTPAEPSEGERAITFRDASGQRTVLVNHTDTYNALKGSPAEMNLKLGLLQAMRRTSQQYITGPAGAVLGRMFAPVGLIRNTIQMPVDLSRGMSSGLIDSLMMNKGYGRFRFPDPTNIPGVLSTAAVDSASAFAKNMSIILQTPANPLTKMMRAIKGNQWVDTLADTFNQHYINSSLGRQHALGIGGQGAMGGVELPTQVLTKGKMNYTFQGRNPLGDWVPGIMGDPKLLGTVRIPTTLSHSYINLRGMVRDVYDAIMSSAHSYTFNLNEMNPRLQGRPNVLAHEIMQSLGDPGTRGAGRIARAWGAAVPYSNISLQDVARMTKVFKDHPLGTTLMTMGTLAAPAIASIYSALVSGPEHINHLTQTVGTAQRASNVIIYHGPGTDPNEHTEISLPQRWRFLYAHMLEMVAAGIDAYKAHQNQPLLERTLDTLGDFFSHHVSNSTNVAAAHGAGDLFSFPFQMPPAGQAALAIGGKSFGLKPEEAIMNAFDNMPFLQSATRGIAGSTSPNMPGVANHDGFMSTNDGSLFQALLSSFFGVAGQAYHNTIGNFQVRNQTGFDHPLDNLISDYKQTLADNSPWGNSVWGSTLRQQTRTPLEEQVNRTLDIMKRTENASAGERNYGFTGANGAALMPSPLDRQRIPSDPVMAQMYRDTGQEYGYIKSHFLHQVTEMRSQMDGISRGPLSPEVKRTLTNGLASKMQDVYKQIDQRITMLNSYLSRNAMADVHVGSIDWSRGREQFAQ